MSSQIETGRRTGSFFIAALAPMMLIAQLGAADEDDRKDEAARRELQLKNMKRFAELYTVSPSEDRKRHFKFHENAVMRFSNPVGVSKDGAVFLWSDRGQPQALLKIFTHDNENFSQEWQSLSENSLVAERDGEVIWNPTEPGIVFRELADAPNPAGSAAERLRQMKQLAGRFRATYDAGGDSKPDELRLLVQPLFRHDANLELKCLDGAVLGFSQSTAPMALLLIEARRDGERDQYYYGFARLSTRAMAARYGDKEIFSVERYDYRRDPKQTFLQLSPRRFPEE
jgi:hypothetical protein